MLVNIKGSDNLQFDIFVDFEKWVISLIRNIKSGYLINNTEINNYYKNNVYVCGIKKLRDDIKNLFYNKTILNSKYWTSRGWTEEESVLKISKEQKKRALISSKKSKEMKGKNYTEWCSTKNTHLEYYIKKGFTYEESKLKLRERQKTFSKEICINKHGKINGVKIWKNRQQKWIESLNKSYEKENYPEKDSSSLKILDINSCIYRNFYKNNEFISDAIEYSNNNIDKFIDYIYQNKNIYSLSEVSYIFNSKILQEFFLITQNELKVKIIKKYGIIPTRFGNIRYYNGHICRSNGEYFISKQLNKLSINYTYEKKYPNSKFVCDFYIKDIDVYVEYMGFLKSDYMHKHNTKICKDYTDRYVLKKQICVDNNLNFIYENDYKLIISKIKEQYDNLRKRNYGN